MTEKTLASKVVKLLRPLDAMRVENPCKPGTPDVEFIGGWVELKHVRDWPKRASTPVRVPHFTTGQRLWLTRRDKLGGLALLLVQVGPDYLLLSGAKAASILGTSTQAQLRAAAIATFTHRTLKEELAACFRHLISTHTNAY